MTENETYQTGDINLAAALMACGVPLSQQDPAVMVQPEYGKRYASFRLLGKTIDGKDDTKTMMTEWNRRGQLPPDHGFVTIADFLLEKRRMAADAKSSDDLLGFAVQYLAAMEYDCPGVRTVADIPDFVRRAPNAPDTYILAFIHCRDLLFGVVNEAKRTDHYIEREGRHAIISNTLPAWQRKELTSRLNG